jgi:hypothetical protein
MLRKLAAPALAAAAGAGFSIAAMAQITSAPVERLQVPEGARPVCPPALDSAQGRPCPTQAEFAALRKVIDNLNAQLEKAREEKKAAEALVAASRAACEEIKKDCARMLKQAGRGPTCATRQPSLTGTIEPK